MWAFGKLHWKISCSILLSRNDSESVCSISDTEAMFFVLLVKILLKVSLNQCSVKRNLLYITGLTH